MEELITIIGELSKQDLDNFLSNYNLNDIDDLITFLYNLNDDDVQEVMKETLEIYNEIHINKIDD